MTVRLLIPFVLLCIELSAQSKSHIDSINNLYVQGLNIPQDSMVFLFRDNLKNATKINYKLGMADAHSQLSLVYNYQAKYDQSLENAMEAIKIYEKLGQLNRVADYYAEMGYRMKYRAPKQALYYMQKGKAIAEANNFENELKDIYNNYGVLKEINHELDSALFYFEQGLKIKQKLNDTIGIPYSWSNMAGVFGLMGNLEKAREYFNKSLQQRLEWTDSVGIAENYTQLGEVFLAENKPNLALPFFHKSLSISTKKKYRNLTQYNYKTLSDLFKKSNNADSALYYFEQYFFVRDSIHNKEIREKIAALNIEFETEKKEKEILQQRADLAEKELKLKQKNMLLYGSLGLALLLGLLGYLLFNQQKLKTAQLRKESELRTALAKIETQNKLQEQRLRISRDLHDNIGAQLTFIISSVDNLKYGFSEISGKLNAKLTGISNFTTQTIYELRDTIWAMNKNTITFEDLQARISNFIEHAGHFSEKTKFSFQIEESISENHSFNSVEGMNIFRIIQEAVNNAVKYSGATTIDINISQTNEAFHIEIKDNGKGFDFQHIVPGNGLNNMKKRSRDIGSKISFVSNPDQGTAVLLQVPRKHSKPIPEES